MLIFALLSFLLNKTLLFHFYLRRHPLLKGTTALDIHTAIRKLRYQRLLRYLKNKKRLTRSYVVSASNAILNRSLDNKFPRQLFAAILSSLFVGIIITFIAEEFHHSSTYQERSALFFVLMQLMAILLWFSYIIAPPFEFLKFILYRDVYQLKQIATWLQEIAVDLDE